MKNVYANFFLLIFLVFTFEIGAQTHINRLDSLFNKIKHSELALRIFFSEMPKGGDLHHHYSGSIYAEQYIEKARSLNAWINPVSLEISFELVDKSERDGWKKFKSYENQIGFYLLQQQLLKHWSVKDYARSDGTTSYDDFFNTLKHLLIKLNPT
jgi:adenosine deaminase/adenosine deaminase CECR1